MTRNPWVMRLVAAAVAVAATLALILTGQDDDGAAPPAPMRLGIQDDRLALPGEDIADRMRLVAGTGVRLVRVDLRWDAVALERPRDATDPADPAYAWDHYDRVVERARARGVEVLFAVWGTPDWAVDRRDDYVSDFPASARAPRDPEDFGRFGAALARRYAPRGVHLWEAWNEPNIPLFLRPQFVRRDGRWVPESPRLYAGLLEAFHRHVKAADPDATVIGGVTAPAGNRCPKLCPDARDDRMYPPDFLRALDADGLRPPMDAVSHHPYPLRLPDGDGSVGTNPDAAYVDLYNLEVLTDTLDGTYLAGRPLWLTEFGVATARVEQYPLHTDEARQAELLTDAVARARAVPSVRAFVWYLLQDHAGWASGLHRRDGTPKPAHAAMRAAAR